MLVRDQDKFMLRLPDGMRDRIKAKADRAGMSMNEAIVWCLDQYFPAPRTFDQQLDELVEKVALLMGDDSSAGVDDLIDKIDETLAAISDKSGFAPSQFREKVSARYSRFLEEEAENSNELHTNPFDDSNYSDPFADQKD